MTASIDIKKRSDPEFIRSRGVPPTRNATIQTPGQLLANCHLVWLRFFALGRAKFSSTPQNTIGHPI